LDAEDLLKDGEKVGTIRVEAEALHLGIGLSLGQVVVGEDAIVEVGGSDGNAEEADPDVGAVGGEEFTKELGACR
jgi:hypothetical protein